MPTLVVPDTNVFVQFQSFEGLPWREISGQDEVVLVVVAAVVRELDKLKLEPRLRDRVRDVLPRVEALFSDADDALLPGGTPARFEHGRDVQDVMQRHGLELQCGDDRILATVLKLHEGGAKVIVVTDDAAVRLRARGLGLATRPIPEKYRRLGADPLQAENAKLRRELEEVRNAMPRLELRFTEGGDVLKVAQKPLPGTSRNRFHDAMRMRPMSLSSLPIIYEMELEKPTQAEVDAYNKRLEEFRPTYEKYVAERDAFELFPHRSFALELSLRNGGGRPAEGVQLALQLPDDVTVVDEDEVPEEPPVPVGPSLPGRKRGIYAVTEQMDSLRNFAAPRSILESLDLPRIHFPGPPPNVTGPHASAREVRFHVRLLSNFDEVDLPRCLLSFSRPEDVRSLRLPYKLRSHSLPRLVEGELHVVVVVVVTGTVEPPPEGGGTNA
jgi:rRNA-processing protein FCF1